jgi:hypothetical protein
VEIIKNAVFWDVTPYGLVHVTGDSEVHAAIILWVESLFYTEDEGRLLRRDVGNIYQVHGIRSLNSPIF